VPFTISHAAAVLPLHKLSKSRLPMAALMIGSMAPDFAYFLPLQLSRASTHDFLGLFWFCWPVGLAVWLLYLRLLERPTIALLPEPWASRIIPSESALSLVTLSTASVAIILGAVTHDIWDAFTHANTRLVDAIPFLRAEVMKIHGMTLHVFGFLQLVSSVVGLLVLAIWGFRSLRRAKTAPAIREPSTSISDVTRVGALALVLASSCVFAVLYYALNTGIALRFRLFYFAIGGMTGALLAWCAIAAFVRWKTRRSQPA
jgi:hypothetical protein